jgi:malonyl-CoA O-methyltransferase
MQNCQTVNFTPLEVTTLTQSKRLIGKAFSKGCDTYQSEALIQLKSALALSRLFDSEIPQGPLLEIGCGTGFLSKEILKKYPERSYKGIDISDAMISHCREHLRGQFEICDGESIRDENSYAAIFSGMALQWFSNPQDSIKRIRKALVKGGVFYFSFPNHQSFSEWGYFPLNPLPNPSILLNVFDNPVTEELIFQETFHHPLDFLKKMQRIGTGTSTRSANRHLILKKLIKESKSEHNRSMTITTRITIGYCYV